MILSDGVGCAEALGEHDERAGLRIDSDETAAGESRVVVGNVDALRRVELAEQRVTRRDRQMADLVALQVVDADVPGEPGRIKEPLRRCGDAFGGVTASVVRVREVPHDALRGRCGQDGSVCFYEIRITDGEFLILGHVAGEASIGDPWHAALRGFSRMRIFDEASREYALSGTEDRPGHSAGMSVDGVLPPTRQPVKGDLLTGIHQLTFQVDNVLEKVDGPW